MELAAGDRQGRAGVNVRTCAPANKPRSHHQHLTKAAQLPTLPIVLRYHTARGRATCDDCHACRVNSHLHPLSTLPIPAGPDSQQSTMPPSTRRQAATRNHRYSEVSAGGLSDDLAADEDYAVAEDELDEQEGDPELQEAFEELPGMQSTVTSTNTLNTRPLTHPLQKNQSKSLPSLHRASRKSPPSPPGPSQPPNQAMASPPSAVPT